MEDFLPAVEAALEAGRDITIRYSNEHGETSWRRLSPIELFEGRNGNTYLRAFCQLRGEDRTFRVDRILAVRADTADAEPVRRSAALPSPVQNTAASPTPRIPPPLKAATPPGLSVVASSRENSPRPVPPPSVPAISTRSAPIVAPRKAGPLARFFGGLVKLGFACGVAFVACFLLFGNGFLIFLDDAVRAARDGIGRQQDSGSRSASYGSSGSSGYGASSGGTSGSASTTLREDSADVIAIRQRVAAQREAEALRMQQARALEAARAARQAEQARLAEEARLALLRSSTEANIDDRPGIASESYDVKMARYRDNFVRDTGVTDLRVTALYVAADLNRNGSLSWTEIQSFQDRLMADYEYLSNTFALSPDQFMSQGGGDCEDFAIMTVGLCGFWLIRAYVGTVEPGNHRAYHAVALIRTEDPPEGYTTFDLTDQRVAGPYGVEAGRYVVVDYDNVGSLSLDWARYVLVDICRPEDVFGARM